MVGTLKSAIFLATVAGGQSCDVAAMTLCQQNLNAVVTQGIAAGKDALCTELATYQGCFIQNSVGCAPAETQKFKDVVTVTKQTMTGTMGVDCLKTSASTEPPLASGDSGSRSGSTPVQSSLSSGSTSASMPWQIAFLLTLFLCCCIAGIGGAVYAMQMKKKKPQPKRPQREEIYEQPEAQPMIEEPVPVQAVAPVAQVAVDVDGDGRADKIVTGVDANMDGIPDALQGAPGAAAVVQDVVQPLAPIVQTYASPVVTGPTTTSSYLPYGAYGAYGASPVTTSYAAPATTYPATTYPATTYPAAGITGTTAYATRIG